MKHEHENIYFLSDCFSFSCLSKELYPKIFKKMKNRVYPKITGFKTGSIFTNTMVKGKYHPEVTSSLLHAQLCRIKTAVRLVTTETGTKSAAHRNIN